MDSGKEYKDMRIAGWGRCVTDEKQMTSEGRESTTERDYWPLS